MEGGWVTLDGSVDYKYEQDAAEYAVRNLTGVKGLTNLIALNKPQVKASDVKTSIKSALKTSCGTRRKSRQGYGGG